jgi:hypothetical protein
MNFLAHSLSSCDSAWHLARLLFTTLLLSVIPLQAAPLSGTRTIGPTGDYPSITAAIADVQAQTLGGALILELESSYVSGVENFPLTIPALNGASAVNTVTLRPQAGADNLVITSYDNLGTVALSGTRFFIIDGRAGGTGTAKQLTFENNSSSGVALRFINEASGNTLRHVTLQGSNTSATSGVVVFDGTNGANGNDNNTLEFCDVSGNGSMTPANCIYSFGVASIPAPNNSGNTISNCNLFNFHANTGSNAAGVRLDDGNTDWIIAGNSFFQTTTRTASPSIVRPIYVNSPSGGNFTVTGNFIGGRAASAGGTAWTTSGTAAYGFVGIHLNVGTAAPSSVQGNIIRGITWRTNGSSTALPGIWSGIYVQAGAADIGTAVGNTIGGDHGYGTVYVSTSGNGGTTFGICSASSAAVTIANNTIKGISVSGTNTNISASLVGIQVDAGPAKIENNTVGSTSIAYSLDSLTASVSSIGQQVTGILSISTKNSIITGNTVANLNNNYAGTNAAGQVRGIVTTAGPNTISGNTVRSLSTTSRNPGNTMSASVLGISQTSTDSSQLVSQNLVHSLSNSTTLAAVTVAGILYNASNSSANIIARNQVHSLNVSSPFQASGIIGIQIANGAFTARNNMVRVGINAAGGSAAGSASVFGILESGTAAGRNFHHNSVYVGGTQVSGESSTYAIQSAGATGERTIRNNIFVNARTNSSGTGKHYSVAYGGTTANPTGLTAGGNIFLASGTGGVLGLYNSADRATLVDWQAATGQDATSAVVDPLFVDPTGTAATVDLHLQPNNPAESGALSIGAVTDDFDGQSRGGLFADVGADAGDFTLSSDVFAPGISYPPLTVSSTASRVLTGWATITDSVGVSSGARLYYKKSTDADVFGVANDSTGNGWKHATATGSDSFYSFTIDHTLLTGGGVTPGDTIQYFVVAQDAANNLGSSPAGANASASPPVQNVNAHGTVNSYTIVASLSGTKTVGSGGDYPSLTGAGGLFAALNNSALTGNLVVNITSDVVENGGVGLNSINSNEYPQAFNITIQPGSATMRTISGSSAAGLIRLNGTDHVNIDGRSGGTGRYLTFRNASIGFSASTLLFINDASNNIVRGCIFEGNETGARGVISFLGGVMTGNDDNLITGCQVRDLSTAASMPVCLVSSFGTSAAVANSGNTISDNELFNFNLSGVNLNTGTESWTISGNNIYKVNASIESTPYGIEIACGGTNFITGNFIHDLVTNVSSSIGINFRGNAGTTTISGNRITAFNVTAAMQAVVGIYADGGAGSTLNLVNNQITLMPAAGGSVSLYGLIDGSFGGVVNVFHNTILIGGVENGTRSSWASYRNDASLHTARNNILFNLRNGGTGNHYAAGSEVSGGSYTASNNLYAGTGSAPASFMDFSSIRGTAVSRTFAEWQILTGDTNSAAGIAGSNGFTASLFANAASGDLHLGPVGSQLVNTTGISIVGLDTDYDGDQRRALTPSIGSDEAAVTFSEWATSANLIAENAAPTAIPYHDGIKNLLKYAFNLNGGGPDLRVLPAGGTAGLPRITLDASGVEPVLRVEFLRRKGSGITYTPQRSSSLNGWVTMTGAEVVTSIDSQWERVNVEEATSLSTGSSLFARVQVTLP